MSITQEGREALKFDIIAELKMQKAVNRDSRWFGKVYEDYLYRPYGTHCLDRSVVPLGRFLGIFYSYKFAEALRQMIKGFYHVGYMDKIENKDQALRIAGKICTAVINILTEEGLIIDKESKDV